MTTIYVHAYLTVPIPAAIVTTVKITKEHDGPYGTHSVASVPVIAGGSGSVTSFNLTFQKKLFSYRGKKHGYLLAKCANGQFLAQAEAVFRDGSRVKGKIARACTPKGIAPLLRPTNFPRAAACSSPEKAVGVHTPCRASATGASGFSRPGGATAVPGAIPESEVLSLPLASVAAGAEQPGRWGSLP